LIPNARRVRGRIHVLLANEEPSQLDRIEKKIDDLAHEVRRKNGA
jgi:hypothetical protein